MRKTSPTAKPLLPSSPWPALTSSKLDAKAPLQPAVATSAANRARCLLAGAWLPASAVSPSEGRLRLHAPGAAPHVLLVARLLEAARRLAAGVPAAVLTV